MLGEPKVANDKCCQSLVLPSAGGADLIQKVTSVVKWISTSSTALIILCFYAWGLYCLYYGLKNLLQDFCCLSVSCYLSSAKLLIRTVERSCKLQTSQFPELLKNLLQLWDVNISYRPTEVSKIIIKRLPSSPTHLLLYLCQIKIFSTLVFFMTSVPLPLQAG